MKHCFIFVLLVVFLAGCGTGSNPLVTETPSPEPTKRPTTTATLTIEPSPAYPSDGYGPSGFPSNINPLTGLQVVDPILLERRPVLVKVTNLPRYSRQHWGVSLADIVFEYYTEDGGTRFAVLFLGDNAERVGPIRSARFMDTHLVRGYKAVFAFGSAYSKVWERLLGSGFGNRLVIEGSSTPLYRYAPDGDNYLAVSTSELSTYVGDNEPQDLDGMYFRLDVPPGGADASQVIVRYSGSIYNRWDYDPASGKYLRYADADDDYNRNNEQYVQAIDRLTGQPLVFDNLIILAATNEYYSRSPEVMDIQLVGSGTAYIFRDGQVYQVTWQRGADTVISLSDADGRPFPFKPGTSFYEIVGARTSLEQSEKVWRFTHLMP